jgi:hypothetical protein
MMRIIMSSIRPTGTDPLLLDGGRPVSISSCCFHVHAAAHTAVVRLAPQYEDIGLDKSRPPGMFMSWTVVRNLAVAAPWPQRATYESGFD